MEDDIVGVVLVEVDVGIEVDEECQVLGTQHALQELDARFLLDGQYALLAGTGVNQQTERQRLVGICREILDGLRLAVFDHFEVVSW